MLLLFLCKEKEITVTEGSSQVHSKAEDGAQAAGPGQPLSLSN